MIALEQSCGLSHDNPPMLLVREPMKACVQRPSPLKGRKEWNVPEDPIKGVILLDASVSPGEVKKPPLPLNLLLQEAFLECTVP